MTSQPDFTDAARAEAERYVPAFTSNDYTPNGLTAIARLAHVEGWKAARTHLAAQETDGERAVRELHRPVDVEPSDTICAACSTLRGSGESLRYFPTKEWPCATIQALDAARRDKEKRDD